MKIAQEDETVRKGVGGETLLKLSPFSISRMLTLTDIAFIRLCLAEHGRAYHTITAPQGLPSTADRYEVHLHR